MRLRRKGGVVKPGGDNVLRVERIQNFKTVDLTATDDPRLSWKAVGIHLFLVSRPDGWSFYEADLVQRHRDGAESLRSGLRELEDAGYLDRSEVIQDRATGRITGRRWTVRETAGEPVPPKTHGTGFPSDGEPHANNKGVETSRNPETEPPPPPAGAGGVVAGEVSLTSQPIPPKDDRKQREAEAVEEVLADWRDATGRNRFFRPVDDSWKKARAALRYGFTRAQLRLAVAGALATPWNCGENPNGKKYLNPDNIFRSSETIDRHMDTARTRCTPESWWPAPDADFPASPAGMDAPAPEPVERAMTGFDLDMQALVQELFAARQDKGRIIAIKRRLGCLGEEVGVRGVTFPPFPEEFEALEVAA